MTHLGMSSLKRYPCIPSLALRAREVQLFVVSQSSKVQYPPPPNKKKHDKLKQLAQLINNDVHKLCTTIYSLNITEVSGFQLIYLVMGVVNTPISIVNTVSDNLFSSQFLLSNTTVYAHNTILWKLVIVKVWFHHLPDHCQLFLPDQQLEHGHVPNFLAFIVQPNSSTNWGRPPPILMAVNGTSNLMLVAALLATMFELPQVMIYLQLVS